MESYTVCHLISFTLCVEINCFIRYMYLDFVFFFSSFFFFFFFQAEDGIRDLVRSRGLGDVYKRQAQVPVGFTQHAPLGGIAAHRIHIMVDLRLHVGQQALSLIHI